MSEQYGAETNQSPQFDTILLINDQLAGNPGQHVLTTIGLPSVEKKEELIFQTSYLFPELNLTYIFITVSHWSANWGRKSTFLRKLGTIVLPMIQSQEPKLQTLSEVEVSSFLGFDACRTKAVKCTIIGIPRFHKSEYMTNISSGLIREEVGKIASMIDGTSKMKIDLLHPIFEKTNDLTLDPTFRILEIFIEGWHRDANNPLSSYFANSRSNRMLDLETVPRGGDIPYMDQLPALPVFDSKEQYYVAMAIGNQQEKEHRDRKHGKLHEIDLPALFIPDRRSLHPKGKAPQEYFMLINASSAGADTDFLLPRIGESAEIVLKGISTKDQETDQNEGEVDVNHIAKYIQASVADVFHDNSIESLSAFHDKLQGMLKILCIRDESGNEIAANLEKLRSNLEMIEDLSSTDEELSEFVRSNRTWLGPPPTKIGGVNPFSDPVCLHGHRIDVPSTLLSVKTHVWKLRVPLDKATGSAELPLILNIPDPSVDDAGNTLETISDFTERCIMSDANVNVRMKIIDSDKTHRAEMNALKKLLAPHTMPMDDRPSLSSINAVEDLIDGKLRDGQALKEIMTSLEKLRRGIHEDKKLQYFYRRLSKDKHGAIQYLLDDKKLIKYIHGPLGTGKSYLALWIACIALMFEPPTTGIHDEWDRPLDLGPQLKPEEFDKVDLSKPLRALRLTSKEKAAPSSAPRRTRVLIVSGQNTVVDNLVSRLLPLWKDLGGYKVCQRNPVVLRLYSWEYEGREFVRRFTKVGRHIQRTSEETAGGILMHLLDAFSDKADELDRKGRKDGSSILSIVDKAVELYNADRMALGIRKYDELALLINQAASSPAHLYRTGKKITHLIMTGPQTEALTKADVIFGTLVGVADKTFRQTFRPHYIISDESPRDKEVAFLILLAHFSPRAYFCFGDHKQLGPVIFSRHQHRKYKPPRSFEQAGIEHSSGVSETQEQSKEEAIKDLQRNQEDDLPSPSTFARQMEWSVIHRLMEAGNQPSYMLTQNWHQHGLIGEFFSEQFYDGKIKFQKHKERLGEMDKAAVHWIKVLSGKEQIKSNTLMVNMNSTESCEARSFCNRGNVNYVLVKVVELLADPRFCPTAKDGKDGKVMIIAPYDAQRSLYIHELQKRGNFEMDSKGNWVPFDKSRVEIRTHQGAQGHEASVVIIDLTRSVTPGMTGQSQLINVCSSRAICAQLVLINTSIFEHVESKNSPSVRNLVAWVQFHQQKDMFIDMDIETAKSYCTVCSKCYGIDHKSPDCPYLIEKPLNCPNCGQQHHPRDCYKVKSNSVRAKAVEQVKKPAETLPTI